MGNVTVKIPLSFVQTFTDDTEFVQYAPDIIEVSGNTVGECLTHLVEQYPHIKKQLFNKNGNLLGNVLISVNGVGAYPEQLAKQVNNGDELDVVFMVSGG